MRKNMNNDDETYLWDQSGEPDSEIQELERVLSTLRYQPPPLVIPDDLQTIGPSRWNFGPRLAIAATILLAVGAAALWLSLERRDTPELATKKPAAVSNSDRAAVTVPTDVLSEIPGSVPGNAPSNAPGSVPASSPNDLNEKGEDAGLPPNHRVNYGAAAFDVTSRPALKTHIVGAWQSQQRQCLLPTN